MTDVQENLPPNPAAAMPRAALSQSPAWKRILLNQQAALVLLILIEVLIFGKYGENFFTAYNAMEMLRSHVELGLLALALTPIIVTGGIDLSVGSLMALCAIMFGKFARDYHLSIPVSIVLTLLVGTCCGGLNALLITILRIPPLIVTLGTFSLFRGLAEGITKATKVYGFSKEPSFIFWGQRYFFNETLPAQAPFFIFAVIVFWILLHRTTIGRSIIAIGFSPAGARYAGIPVNRRLALVYMLCGFVSAGASIIYVARTGSAKADAGSGYELMAITAVVLGGTSIFGGRGTIIGTLLGLAVIAILENGLRLADQPSELAQIIGGVLLIVAIAVGQALVRLASGRK